VTPRAASARSRATGAAAVHAATVPRASGGENTRSVFGSESRESTTTRSG
jgi:hypothetical protein